MEDDIDRLRRREAELEAEIARLKAEIASGIHSPDSGQKTSAAGPELLFTAAEKTRMPQIITDPNQPDNPIVFANRAFQDLCGYSAEELVGHNCRFLQGPGTDPADVARLRDAIAARRDVVVEIINYHRDGTPFRNELYVSPVFDRDGRLRYFFGSQLDVTRFRTEEGKLAESESRYRTLFDAIDAGFCIVEMRFDATGRAIDYRFIEVNPAFERQAGLGDVEGRWVSEVIPGIEPRWLETYGEVALSGNPVRFESGAVTLGRWFDVHALRIGEPVQRRVAILFNDITDRREAETVLRTTARGADHGARPRLAREPRPPGDLRLRWNLPVGQSGLERDAGLARRFPGRRAVRRFRASRRPQGGRAGHGPVAQRRHPRQPRHPASGGGWQRALGLLERDSAG